MSIVHFVHATQKIQTILIVHQLGIIENKLKAVDNDNDAYYLYTHGASARGIDISLENNVLEIRTTTLSNRADYNLANAVAEITLDLFGGKILSEDNTLLKTTKLFDNETIEALPIRDAEVLKIMSRNEKNITIFCPLRLVHFGQRLYKKLERLEGGCLYNEIFKIMYNVQYELPDYEGGSILRIGEGENAKLLKVLSNEVDYIVNEYDYILLSTHEEEKPIMIDDEILHSILPATWKLVDEKTLVAPIIEESEWLNLIEKTRPLSLFESYSKK
jgi:hypothetical protein